MSQTKAQLISDLVQALNFTGTATAPANGLFLSATNTLALATNSGQRLTIDSSGNVGIGTTSPDTLLDVSSSDDAVVRIQSEGSDSTDDARLEIKTTNGTFTIQNDRSLGTSGALTFAGNSSNNLVIDHDGGNIGIGTTSPGTKLDVAGDIRVKSSGVYKSGHSGSASAPLYTTNDADTGMFSGGSNQLAFATGSNERLRIDSSGNVGIGTTSPAVKLHLSGTSGLYTRFQNTSAGNNVNFGQSAGDGIIDVGGSFGLRILTNSNDRVKVDSSGNVGIGTTSPGQLLHVNGITQATQFKLLDNAKAVYGNDADMEIYHNAANSVIQNGTGALQIITTTGNLFFRGQDAIAFNTAGNNERMRITSAGRLGLGTTSPDSRLHLSYDSGDSQIRLTRSNAAANTNDYGRLLWESQDDVLTGKIAVARETAENNGYMHFSTASGGTLAERMRITSSGNVGIGTTSPTKPSSSNTNTRFMEISSADGADLILGTSTTSIGVGDHVGTLAFKNVDSNPDSGVPHYAGIRCESGNTSGSMDLRFYVGRGNLESDATNMIISSAGLVGIGTSSPAVNLDVSAGSGTTQIYVRNTATSGQAALGVEGKNSSGTVRTMLFKYDNNDSFRFATAQAVPITFSTSDAERMRIDSSGLISLATTTTANARLFVNPNVDGTTQRGITISGRKDVYDVIALNFVHATNNSSAGSVQFTTTAAVQYNTTSDYRLKQDVATLTDSITKLKQLNPVHFKWKDMPSVESDGFLAHEVQTVVPSAITGEKDALDKDGNIEPQQIDIGGLTPLLTSALQEAIAKIETLEAKVAALEAA